MTNTPARPREPALRLLALHPRWPRDRARPSAADRRPRIGRCEFLWKRGTTISLTPSPWSTKTGAAETSSVVQPLRCPDARGPRRPSRQSQCRRLARHPPAMSQWPRSARGAPGAPVPGRGGRGQASMRDVREAAVTGARTPLPLDAIAPPPGAGVASPLRATVSRLREATVIFTTNTPLAAVPARAGGVLCDPSPGWRVRTGAIISPRANQVVRGVDPVPRVATLARRREGFHAKLMLSAIPAAPAPSTSRRRAARSAARDRRRITIAMPW